LGASITKSTCENSVNPAELSFSGDVT